MSVPDRKYVKKYDEKTRTWLVWRRGEPIFVGEPTKPHPKAADLDEVFGRKPKPEDNHVKPES